MNIDISLSDEILEICPDFKAGIISCKATNSLFDKNLWVELTEEIHSIKNTIPIDKVSSRPAINAARRVYKKLGKDPNRYRQSAEALMRRAVRGLELHNINTLVDLVNLVSLHSGYAIGAFDSEKITGNLVLGVGRANETFEAIGRGKLNIESLPVYRDNNGGVGTPTSDEERTKITENTRQVLIIINTFGYHDLLEQTLEHTEMLIKKYAGGQFFERKYLFSTDLM